jgi:adenosine deaminase
MSVTSYFQALPKVELGVQFEGVVPQKTLLMIADQNDRTTVKGFANTKKLMQEPDYNHLEALTDQLAGWVEYPDDLTRMAYDIGVALGKQNIHYAEIGVNPLLYTQGSMSFEKFIEALYDGADRAKRGWNVTLTWVLNIPRADPRRADELTRWALGATGRKNGVVALGLSGKENLADIAQFERPFKNVEKKDLPRVIQAGDVDGATELSEVLSTTNPTRLIGGWGAVDSEDVLNELATRQIPVAVCPTRELRYGRVAEYGDYPLRRLLDAGVQVVFTALLPELFKTTLADEYAHAVEAGLVSVDEAEEIALNSIRHSLLPADARAALIEQFETRRAELKAEHLA